MNLTENFTLKEFTRSDTATRFHIDNTPPPHCLAPLHQTALGLQTLRDALCEHLDEDTSVNISSGYRSPKLNNKIKGSSTSDHMRGYAADIWVEGWEPEELVRFMVENGMKFDKLINEYDRWVHVSFKSDMRGLVYRADRVGLRKKTVYTRLL